MSADPRIVLVAGEASGDALGASLINAARELRPDISFAGIAGPAMRAAGCESWHDADELAVMGLAEVMRHLPRILGVKRSLERRVLAEPPAVFVGIDAPDFNLRVERSFRAAGIPTVHYVSPSVWAWRQGRVKGIRKACSHVLCLLPFESEFLTRHGISAEFVGHPLADQLAGQPDAAAARQHLGLADGPVIALLPGSRGGEVARLGPVFAQTAAWISAQRPDIQFVAAMARPGVRAQFEKAVLQFAPDCRISLVDGQAQTAIAASDAVLICSGTATLEALLLQRPMVAAYQMSPVTHALLRWTALANMKFFTLPNLLTAEPLVPEFIQDAARPEALGGELLDLLDSKPRQARIASEFARVKAELQLSAADRAARAVLRVAGLAAPA